MNTAAAPSFGAAVFLSAYEKREIIPTIPDE